MNMHTVFAAAYSAHRLAAFQGETIIMQGERARIAAQDITHPGRTPGCICAGCLRASAAQHAAARALTARNRIYRLEERAAGGAS